jgi:putative membrane protein
MGVFMKRKQIEILVLIVMVILAGACRRKEEPVPVETATVVDTTPTGGTIATATIALTEPDRRFVLDAAAAVLGEAAFAKTADLLSPDTAVKAFAHILVLDFADMYAEVTAIGRRHDVALPTEVEIAASNEALSKLKGREFNKVYLQRVVDDHVALIALLEAESKVVSDDDIRTFVDKWRPKLQNHLDTARKLQAKFAR